MSTRRKSITNFNTLSAVSEKGTYPTDQKFLYTKINQFTHNCWVVNVVKGFSIIYKQHSNWFAVVKCTMPSSNSVIVDLDGSKKGWMQAAISNGFRDIQLRMSHSGWHDLDTTSKRRSRSFILVPIDFLYTTSYKPSIVTFALGRTV